jgi:phospholipid N-methyltransferase
MPQSTHWVFAREFVRRHHTTGSILPSSRFLANALTRPLREDDGGTPRRILEVGPGTGPVTRRIVEAMRPGDRLDLVEINEHFVELLRRRFDTEPAFRSVADRAQIHCLPIEELPADEPYDVLISGLPLNNFDVATVEGILNRFGELARAGGRLSFFEYVAIRRFKALCSGRAERERLRGVGRALKQFLTREVRRDAVLLSVPPAWVHHVRFDAAAEQPAADGGAPA